MKVNEISLDPIFYPLNFDEYQKTQNKKNETNYDKLPLLFNPLSKPFVGNHLYSIYRESYFCILNGFYHAGIVLLSQLLEETLREIMRINADGDYRKSNFEDLIKSAKRENSGLKKIGKPFLVHPILLDEIEKIKDDIRNSYVHLRYDRMFKDQITPVALIKFNLESQSQQNPQKNDSIDENIPQLFHLPLDRDPVISSIFKEERDKKIAFELAWKIFGLYWLLLELHLTLDKYEEHVKKYGSYLKKLQPIKKKDSKIISIKP